MAAFNHVRDINDLALKPRLLHVLLKEHIPSETSPFRNPADVAFVVSTVKTHQLLSEDIPPHDTKLASSWSSAVDTWVSRVLSLARCNSPDKCWAGVCLLGVTCIECKSERLVDSFSEWCNVILSHIQSSGASQIVRVASCAAVSDLLTRIGAFSKLKKDGISLAGKLLQTILKILSEDATEELLDVTAHLLLTVLENFPLSVQRYYDDVEAAIVSRIMSGKCSVDFLKKLSCCLALLPKSRVDEKSWSLMMQKILLALSALLDSALDGLEEESKRGEAVAFLVPPGKDPPPPLGAHVIGEVLGSGERSQQTVISAILSLLQCCSTMLTNPYPVQVVVPVRPLLAVIQRVLMVNGSLPEALQAYTTAMQQELVCLQLPLLHTNVLDILGALDKGLRSQILPHAADIIRLLIKYFEKCVLPELRTKAYAITKSLLISMGAGMALYISQDVIDNGLIDLKAGDSGANEEPCRELTVEPSSRHHKKKRKHGYTTESVLGQHALAVEEPNEHLKPVSLKIAATEALEALLIMGGALRSDSWRSGVDLLLMEVATNACKRSSSDGGQPFLLRGPGEAFEEFQLVALHALLASLLSPASVRPPHLAQGLELFHRGKQNTGTKVAEFCAQSLLALEVLIHPRALSLIDVPLPSGNTLSRMDFGGSKSNPRLVSSRVHGVYPDVYDVQDYVNMEDSFETEVPAAEVNVNAPHDRNKLDVSMDQGQDEPNIVDDSSGRVVLKDRDEHSEPIRVEDERGRNKDTVMLDAQPNLDSDRLSPVRMPLSAKMTLKKDATASVTVGKDASALLTLGNNPSASENSESMPAAKSAAPTTGSSMKRVIDEDDDSSDSFPGIVDADPDTDSDSGT